MVEISRNEPSSAPRRFYAHKLLEERFFQITSSRLINKSELEGDWCIDDKDVHGNAECANVDVVHLHVVLIPEENIPCLDLPESS